LRVAFFAWLATLGKILNMDNLEKKRVIVINWWCCMCKGTWSLWIISFSIVRLLVPYGILFSVVLGCLGLYLNE
jgi:hypothetical protein